MPSEPFEAPVDNSVAPFPTSVSLPALLEDGTDDTFRRIASDFLILRTMSATWRNNQARLLRERYGLDLTASEVTFLSAVLKTQSNGSTTAARLGEYLKIGTSAVSNSLNRMVTRGYLMRLPDPVDSRRLVIRLTDEGTAAIRTSFIEQRRVNDLMYADFEWQDLLTFGKLLATLIEGAEAAITMQNRILNESA
ncbi:MarR family winged helix-turn-helix transcriptional regulator [Nocardioides sp. NPDC004968]|uniref:MarR family winged helix-turn-helix transcriptional regulator n=1 Tax=Nocardioides sp. NPDC004968 TaxID=3155894 RepID=UPI0033AF2EF9